MNVPTKRIFAFYKCFIIYSFIYSENDMYSKRVSLHALIIPNKYATYFMRLWMHTKHG